MDHKNQHRWHLLFVLPNLVLKEPIECGFVALVPNQDSRLDEARVGASGKLLSSFENPFQKALQPTALITYQSAEERQPLDALLAFRNAVALAALIDEWTKAHRHPGNGGVLYSDWFDLHPFTPSNDNARIVISSPTTSGASFPDSFRGQCSAAIPYPFHLPLLLRDRTLLNPLLRQWHERFVQKKKERKTTVLFRSLAIAFEAAKFPSNPTLYEIGTRVVLWVSAFEVLVHPGHGGQADLGKVLDLLSKAAWQEKRLKDRKFRIKLNKKTTRTATLCEKLYKQLYDARNDFAHGNPVNIHNIVPFKNKNLPHFHSIAPLIYRAALSAYLDLKAPPVSPQTGLHATKEGVQYSFSQSNYADALLSAMGAE